jgi:hypothetical protein
MIVVISTTVIVCFSLQENRGFLYIFLGGKGLLLHTEIIYINDSKEERDFILNVKFIKRQMGRAVMKESGILD